MPRAAATVAVETGVRSSLNDEPERRTSGAWRSAMRFLELVLHSRSPKCGFPAFLLLACVVATLAVAPKAFAGDLDDVKARGKLVMLTFPAIEDPFVAVDVEAMRSLGVPLTEIRDPQHF